MPRTLSLAALGVAAFAACATTGPPQKCEQLPFELYVQGGKLLNVNAEGQSMPVEVRAYFLADKDPLEKLDFEDVWRRPEESLGATVLKSTSLTVFPGAEKIQPVEAPPATAYVAFVGLFRQVEGDQWRRIIDVRRIAERCKPGDLHVQVRADLQDNRVIAQERIE